MEKNKFLLVFGLLAFTISLLLGCRYQNNPYKLSSQTLYIENVRNNSLAPQLSSFLNTNLRKEIIKRGYYDLVQNKDSADLLLFLTVDDYIKNTESYSPQDTLLATGFSSSINVYLSLKDKKGDTLIDNKLIKETSSSLRVNVSTSPSSRESIHYLSIGMARKISNTLENYNW